MILRLTLNCIIMPLRSVLFWLHLACGSIAGAVILIMSVTGVLLTFQKQMTEWADRQYWTAPGLPNQRATLSELVQSARGYEPDVGVSSITIYSSPVAPAAVSLTGARILYLDPSTASVRGESTMRMRAFFRLVVGWHRWFNVSGEGRPLARMITGWSNMIFLFLLLSGLYLWLPRRWSWQHFKPILLFVPRATGKPRYFNWHHFFGFWTALPLILIVASATVISFPWASDFAYRVMGDAPPPSRQSAVTTPAQADTTSALESPSSPGADAGWGGPEVYDARWMDPHFTSATNRLDAWRSITFVLPANAAADPQLRIDQGWAGEPKKRHVLTYDAVTQREASYSNFENQSAGRRLRTYLRFAHTGEYYGIWGQAIAGMASLSSVILCWSGIALALGRFKTWRLNRVDRMRPGRRRVKRSGVP